MNRFLVGEQEEGLRILNPPVPYKLLDRKLALNLVAWVAVVADLDPALVQRAMVAVQENRDTDEVLEEEVTP